ncbi:FapA family protein [Pleionea sediminis]|uniref:FapA family protein n=1 Tax=Pleionea sediminis TaxID=2569479 RepID=UPI001184FD0A|nr:FapA family protein [Pleionea sediminis]
MSALKLQWSKQPFFVEAVIEPSEKTMNINEVAFHNFFKRSQFARCHLFEDKVKEVVETCLNINNDPNIGTQIITVAEARDAEFELEIDEEEMSAVVKVTTACHGKTFDFDSLVEWLNNNKVVDGIKEDAVRDFLKTIDEVEPGSHLEAVLATGKLPEPGAKTEFKCLVPTLLDRVLKPRLKDDGTVDLIDLGTIDTVQPQQPIMKRIPATPGTNGFTVTGQTIMAPETEETPFELGEGAERSAEDRHLIIASRSGMPVIIDNGMRVDEVYMVEEADASHGNIIFDGSVVVKGDVSNNVRIEATGSVTVGGSINSATILAGCDVAIANGAAGKKVDEQASDDYSGLSCHVTAGGHINIGYAQYSHLEAGKSIHINKQLLHCRSEAKQSVILGQGNDRKSKLIAGFTKVGESITAGEIGAPAFINTQLFLTANSDEGREEIAQLKEKMVPIKKQLDQLYQVQKSLLDNKEAPDRKKKLEQARNSILSLENDLAPIQEKIKTIEKETQENLEKCHIKVVSKIFPGVRIHFGLSKIRISEEKGSGKYIYTTGKIEFTQE